MLNLIYRVYEFSTHVGHNEPGFISATTVISSLYKAKLTLEGTEKDACLIAPSLKRSSTIGSGFHLYAEKALADDDSIQQELYREKPLDDVVITGTCDLLVRQEDGRYKLGDWKTGYGKERSLDNLEKDSLQMSVYRWLLADEYDIVDEASILFISQSNNVEKEYIVELKPVHIMDEWLKDRLYAIRKIDRSDCNDSVKYNACNYCTFVCSERK